MKAKMLLVKLTSPEARHLSHVLLRRRNYFMSTIMDSGSGLVTLQLFCLFIHLFCPNERTSMHSVWWDAMTSRVCVIVVSYFNDRFIFLNFRRFQTTMMLITSDNARNWPRFDHFLGSTWITRTAGVARRQGCPRRRQSWPPGKKLKYSRRIHTGYIQKYNVIRLNTGTHIQTVWHVLIYI